MGSFPSILYYFQGSEWSSVSRLQARELVRKSAAQLQRRPKKVPLVRRSLTRGLGCDDPKSGFMLCAPTSLCRHDIGGGPWPEAAWADVVRVVYG
jgi:hypothetical protein